MKFKTYPLCDACQEPILQPDRGFVIRGNIYEAADSSHARGEVPSQGGRMLLGDNLSDVRGRPTVTSVCLCEGCFKKTLGLDLPAPRPTTKRYKLAIHAYGEEPRRLDAAAKSSAPRAVPERLPSLIEEDYEPEPMEDDA